MLLTFSPHNVDQKRTGTSYCEGGENIKQQSSSAKSRKPNNNAASSVSGLCSRKGICKPKPANVPKPKPEPDIITLGLGCLIMGGSGFSFGFGLSYIIRIALWNCNGIT